MKSKKILWIVIVAAVLAVAAYGVYATIGNDSQDASTEILQKEIEYAVKKENISISVSENGNVNPEDKRTIKSEIDGTVNEIFVTEGDLVEKDQILVSLLSDNLDDSSIEIKNLNLNIEKAQKELNDLYENQIDLNIYAPASGVVSDLDIEVGDPVSTNYNIATIKDTDNSYIEAYFSESQFNQISVGDSASIFMTMYFSTQTGTVTEKNSTPVQMGGGSFGYVITIKMKNPGGFSTGDTAQVTVQNASGSYAAMENGKIVESETEEIMAKVSGKIKSVNAEDGKYINKGDVIVTIEGDDLSLQIAEQKNAIENYQNQIDDLIEGDTIYSPIKGTVLSINVDDEEVVDRTTALLTVAYLEDMEVVISVDELDINKVELGQIANVTSDAYTNEKFTGKVSKISMEGVNQSGVTTYDVTIKLDDRKSLLSGMNVDVEIIAESRENVITVPIDAVQKLQGEYFVQVKDASGNKTDVNVQLGLATKDKVEITSGLKEGDVVIYSAIQSPSSASDKGTPSIRVPGMGGGGNRPPSGGN
ncbi:MAG: HlyD family efflux transporter periplasmic adaptor subunit [Sedimentibacter sp.]